MTQIKPGVAKAGAHQARAVPHQAAVFASPAAIIAAIIPANALKALHYPACDSTSPAGLNVAVTKKITPGFRTLDQADTAGGSMSPLAIISTLFSLFSSSSTSGASQPNQAGSARASATESSDFSSSLSAQLAALQAPPANSPFAADSAKGTTELRSILDRLQASQGLPPNWRKLTEHPEMARIKDGIAAIQAAGKSLEGVNTSTDTESIKANLQTFAARYNEWISRLDGITKSDTLQTDIQTANSSPNGIEQGVDKIFDAAKSGFQSLHDLGFSIDPYTNLASIDTSKLDALLASQKNIVTNSIHRFSTDFAKAIEPLNLASNLTPMPSAYLDKALAAYAQTNHSA
jgi:hypothetical protein